MANQGMDSQQQTPVKIVAKPKVKWKAYKQ